MISTTGSTRSATSDRTLSTPDRRRAQRSPQFDRARRATDCVQDGAPELLRVLLVARDGHERDATSAGRAVSPRTQQRGLPTPGGAETTVTRLVTARSSSWRRASRSSRPPATETSLEIGCSKCSPRGVVAKLVMLPPRSALRSGEFDDRSIQRRNPPHGRRALFTDKGEPCELRADSAELSGMLTTPPSASAVWRTPARS